MGELSTSILTQGLVVFWRCIGRQYKAGVDEKGAVLQFMISGMNTLKEVSFCLKNHQAGIKDVYQDCKEYMHYSAGKPRGKFLVRRILSGFVWSCCCSGYRARKEYVLAVGEQHANSFRPRVRCFCFAGKASTLYLIMLWGVCWSDRGDTTLT
ncbi:hypothetical protein FRX31_008033 [Thalictrum thalictroides]|uniref:Uncharacterized protein n=1 Tax=Thalictrum thalictroides TaxID=46969 RepID=A0A7J6X0S5_THATH|nr:hypothetical protein FRX31_008033 [Thalictrum thalictroides]